MGKKLIKKSFPLSKVYQLLEPGPVIMLTTAIKGKTNIMTLSWHMMVDFEPPIVACVVSNRNHTFKTLKITKECVINIPSEDLASVAVGVGNVSGSKVDKFKKYHLSQQIASCVKAPLIGECFANLECKVIDTRMAGKYNIFILEVLKAWISPSKKRKRTIHHCGNGVFIIDGKQIKLPSKKK